MRKKICLTLLWFIQLNFVLAQKQTIDSLKELLRSTKADSSKCLVMAKLCATYGYENPDSALKIGEEGLQIAKSIPFAKGEVTCLIEIANIFSQTGNDATALALNLQALKITEREGAYDLPISGRILNGISIAYSDQKDYKNALYYEKQAMNIAFKIPPPSYYLESSLVGLGDIYEKLNQLDSARFYNERGYDVAVTRKDSFTIGNALNNLGNTYLKMRQPAIAMDNYRMSIPYSEKTGDDADICESTLGIAKIFNQQGQNDSSLRYARISIAMAQETHDAQEFLNACNFLADYYKQNHNVDSAYTYLSEVVAAKDTIFSQEKTREIQSLTFDENMRQQEINANKAHAEKEHRKNLELIGITAAIIVLLSLFLLFTQTIIVHERWIKFLGVVGLLVVFEYIYIFIDPYVVTITKESPLWMLLILIAIAIILEPIHHRIEHWITHEMIAKNKRLRLAAAKRTVERLEAENKKEE